MALPPLAPWPTLGLTRPFQQLLALVHVSAIYWLRIAIFVFALLGAAYPRLLCTVVLLPLRLVPWYLNYALVMASAMLC